METITNNNCRNSESHQACLNGRVVRTVDKVNREIIGKTYQKVRQEIFAIFRLACIAEDTCEDLVQDVFMKIMGLDIIIEEQLKGMAVMMAYQKRTDYLRRRA